MGQSSLTQAGSATEADPNVGHLEAPAMLNSSLIQSPLLTDHCAGLLYR